ncbi:unnamed protein product [Lepeophtheirus salmonis]|uniref:(salmon louse) hypothetical protein n=1 Tax=Lepeophtheirus salmonis TaxID=72036 RepID=A0A7R8HFE3_LEPSM|nr:unnamed protein product [Lepeophtheirus salmonis]CAF3042983.1 unnamed protein product [Lepeophtheirus salmonis]
MTSQFKYISLIVVLGAATTALQPGSRTRLSAQKPFNRDGRSLLNTFPFNAGESDADHEHHEHEHHAASVAVTSASDGRVARQGETDDVTLDIGSIAAAGERCIDKVVMVTETEYDDHIECHHSYSERCHTTYTTDFEPQQEEECEENFKKSCFIEYKKVAVDETVKFCHTPFVCEGEGPEECKTVYETECETRYHEHDLLPQKACKQVTKLVPSLKPVEECVDVPKEVCSRSRKNPRKVQKPVVKKWCYVPTEESGLAESI